MLPNFLIIGSQKAGTTSLYHGLRQHPQITMAAEKEINFFFWEKRYRRGIEWYAQQFPDHGDCVGEASPGYICHPHTPARIKHHLPNVKLILTVREPVSRAYSQYWDNRRRLTETRGFEQTYRAHFEKRYRPGAVGYFSRGFYITYIETYLQQFDRSQMLILPAEELWQQPQQSYRAIYQFLNVANDAYQPSMARADNRSTIYTNPLYRFFFNRPALAGRLPRKLRLRLSFGKQQPFRYPPLDSELRAEIGEQYAEANHRLAHFLGRDDLWHP